MPAFAEFSPNDMLIRYGNLTVSTGSSNVVVGVGSYRCVKIFNFGSRGCRDALEVKDGLMAATKNKIAADFGGGVALMDMFTGKASPEGMEKWLSAVWKNRDAFITYSRSTGKGFSDVVNAARMLDNSDAFQALQEFALEYLGMDCNGFVGRYLKPFTPIWGLGHQNDPGQWYKTLKDANAQFRTMTADIEVGDVLISTNKSHIGVVDRVAAKCSSPAIP
jgi:hypothetical protein